MAVMIGEILAQPAPERFDRHEIGIVVWQRHEVNVQACGGGPDGPGVVMRRAISEGTALPRRLLSFQPYMNAWA
jgi:hypothetical protein